MRKFKRIFFLGACVFAIVVALAVFGREVLRPAMPDEWHRLQKNMSRQEFVATLHDEVVDLRELKGFDQATHEMQMLGFSGYWQLWVTYDSSGRVSAAQARFVCRDFGFFNTTRSVL